MNFYQKESLKEAYISGRRKQNEETDKLLKEGKTYRLKAIADARYSAEDIWHLFDMARNNVYPDGNFGDEECTIWGWFHGFRIKEES